MKIYLGADHGGFELKERVREWLLEKDFDVLDMGAKTKESDDDFVDYSSLVAEELSIEEYSMGVLFCRNGVGVSMVANRFPGVRCALGFDAAQIKRAREDDDINCLAIPADYIDFDKTIELVEIFIKTKFSGEDRYIRRLEKMSLLQVSGCCGGGCCAADVNINYG